MRICVLSDLHIKFSQLDAPERERHELILQMLQTARGKYDLIVLNGDIFDLWTETENTVVKQYFPFLHAFAGLQEAGCRFIYISGNHDFWFGSFFRDILPMELHDESCTLVADGKKMLFCHGDLHTVNDTRYQIFRTVIRSRLVKGMYNLLNPDLGLNLGKRLSRSSRLRRINPLHLAQKAAGLERYATDRIRHHGYDIVVMGHSHKPCLKQIGTGIYANGGDGVRNFSYVNIIDGNVELCNYAPIPDHQRRQNV